MALFEIGKTPEIPEMDLTDGELNTSLLTKMKAVDIIPVYYTIDAANLFERFGGFGGTSGHVVSLNYDVARNEFHSKLAGVGISDTPSGIRAWMLNDSNANEQFSNEYAPNKLVDAYDNVVATTKPFTQLMNSIGILTAGTGAAHPYAAALLDGKQASLPKIWNSSEYNPSLEIVIKLNSPYGDVDSITENIVKELIVLLCMVSPLSYDGVTYGNPPFFTVRAYGISMMNIAVLKTLSINRCGGDIRFNALKQPNDILINMSFEPAMPGFAALLSNDIANFQMAKIPLMDGTSIALTKYPGVTTIGNVINSLRPSSPEVGNAVPGFPIGDMFSMLAGLIDFGGWNFDFNDFFDGIF